MTGLVSKKGFWGRLKRPIMAMAPVADITDAAFRRLVAIHGKPDVFFTEFVSADGLCSAGRTNLLRDLRYDEIERPIVAQFFGSNPENFTKCAVLAGELGFDGIDINMGCPVKVICRQGAGASLINQPELAKEIVQATIEGAGDLPVSVKTRIGYSEITLEEWARHLLGANPAAVIFHLRTRKEMYKSPAHWEVVHRVVALARGTGVLILGNGGVSSLEHAERLATETGVDGVMLGHAAFGNPWLFCRSRGSEGITPAEKLDAMVEHTFLFEKLFSGEKNFIVMRKHLMAYASSFRGAKEFRISLSRVRCAADVVSAVESFRKAQDSQADAS